MEVLRNFLQLNQKKKSFAKSVHYHSDKGSLPIQMSNDEVCTEFASGDNLMPLL